MLSIGFIHGILFISLLILSPAHSEVIVGEAGSQFQLKPLDVLNQNIVMVKGMAGGGRVEVEKLPKSSPTEYFIHFRDETGRIYLSTKPLYHLCNIQPHIGKVYTLEKEIVPDYFMVMARYNTARLQAESKNERPPILISDFIDEHRYYIRVYSTELPEGKTIFASPRIKGNLDMKDYPLNFVYTGEQVLIFKIILAKPSEEECSLQIVSYPLQQLDSPTTITIANFAPSYSGDDFRDHLYYEKGYLYLMRFVTETETIEELLQGALIREMLKINISTGEIESVLKCSNLLVCGIDMSVESFIL